ncbi:hypothetical protein AMTRI_Chr02g211710 [Amborella trichopoda]
MQLTRFKPESRQESCPGSEAQGPSLTIGSPARCGPLSFCPSPHPVVPFSFAVGLLSVCMFSLDLMQDGVSLSDFGVVRYFGVVLSVHCRFESERASFLLFSVDLKVTGLRFFCSLLI